MTQVFLTTASTSPWAIPSTFTPGDALVNTLYQGQANYYFFGNATTSMRNAQTFTCPSIALLGSTRYLDTVTALLAKAGAPADAVNCYIYDSTMTTLIATATNSVGGGAITTGFASQQQWTFSPAVPLTAGTTYAVVWDRSSATADATNYYKQIGNSAGVYGGGSAYQWNGSSWALASGATLSFAADHSLFTMHLMGSGGSGAAGTTGTSGVGGGGGTGGIWNYYRYANTAFDSEFVPGQTTVTFNVTAGGAGAGFTAWCNTTNTNAQVSSTGGNASGSTGGGKGSGAVAGVPFMSFNNPFGWFGGNGGNSTTTAGGSGGGGASGPNNGGTNSNNITTTGASGGCGGGGGSASGLTAPSAPTGATGTSGGQGYSGTPGGVGVAGTGASGGGGSNGVASGNTTAGAGGGTDTEFDASHGCGGGGGGSGGLTGTTGAVLTGGNGGLYGAGGGGTGYSRATTGSTLTVGVGTAGLIVLFYNPGTPLATTQVIFNAGAVSPFTFPASCQVAGHTVEMLSGGGNSTSLSNGTTGTGGGGGGGYWKGTYASGAITPGSTTIPFLVTQQSGTPGNTQWGSSTAGSGNGYYIAPGGQAGLSTGGAGGGTLTTTTPTFVYGSQINHLGGAGGASGTTRGGGGGGGCGGPLAAGGSGGTSTSTGGSGGGGSNNGTAGNGTSSSTSSGTGGGQGSSGSPGNNGAMTSQAGGSGTGSSGGSGGNGGSTTANQSVYGGHGGNYLDNTDMTWDVTYGFGGGAGGCGTCAATTGTSSQYAGNSGYYGGGTGGWGSAGTSAFAQYGGFNTGGIIIIKFLSAQAVAPLMIGPGLAAMKSMYGPGNRYNADLLASPLPAVSVGVTFNAGTLPFMGVG